MKNEVHETTRLLIFLLSEGYENNFFLNQCLRCSCRHLCYLEILLSYFKFSFLSIVGKLVCIM
jgi:hypothetical protein